MFLLFALQQHFALGKEICIQLNTGELPDIPILIPWMST